MALRAGLLFPLQGPAAAVSRASVEGATLALALAREDGIEIANDIEFVVGDTPTPEQARSQAERLIRDERVAVLQGSAVSAICLAASEVAEQHGVPFWEVAAVADEVTTRGFRSIFQLNANGQDFARGGIDFAAAALNDSVSSTGRAAVVFEDSPFASSVGRAVASGAAAAGMDVVAVPTHRRTAT